MTIIKHWELIKYLTEREIKARYKQSFLGFFWVVLNPFFQMVIMSFIFSKIMRVNNLGVPYPIFLYAGLLPWLFFANSLSNATEELIENASLIKKIYFPRQILVLAALLAKAFDFSLSALIFLVLMVWFKIPFTPFMTLDNIGKHPFQFFEKIIRNYEYPDAKGNRAFSGAAPVDI